MTEKVTALLTAGRHVRIEKQGHSLSFSIEDRNGVPSTGMYLNPGESGNLPSGEAYIAPVEGKGEGSIVVDGSVAGIGALREPMLLTVSEGRLVSPKDLMGLNYWKRWVRGMVVFSANSGSVPITRHESRVWCWKMRRCTAQFMWPLAAITHLVERLPQVFILM